MSAGGRQSTVGGNALAKVSVNGTHLEAQMGALLSSVILPHHALEMPCAGYGRCGKCRVVAHGALSALSDAEREHLSPQDISRGVRLACCARVEGDCTVTLEGAAASQIRLAGEMPDFVHDPIFSVCGAAVDIGTTTLASCLYGPDGTLLAQASAPNPQAGWGADVISRIEAALHGSGDALAASVRAGVRALVLEMAASAHISAEAVDALVITGNTAMLYLLTQTGPDCLSHAPFAASRLFGETLAAGELGLPCPHAQVYLPRCMSALWVRTSPRRCWPAASAPSRTLACWWILEPTAKSLFGIAGSFPAAPRPPGPPLRGPGFPWGWPERRAQWITSAYRTAHCRPTSLGAARRKGSAAAASSTRLPACWSWSSWTKPGFWSRTLRPLLRLYA